MDIRDVLFDTVYELAAADDRLIFITADADAFSLHKFKKDFPDRFINIGVAEQALIDVAAGIALTGKKVFVYAITPFITMRVFEHIKTTMCAMNLPVVIIGLGVGLSFGNDGPTHHATQDISIMRALPELSIYNPFDAFTAKESIIEAYEGGAPSYIRLDKGEYPNREYEYKSGVAVRRVFTADRLIISTGTIVHTILEVDSYSDVWSIVKLKPLCIKEPFGYKEVFVIEEHSKTGGLGSALKESFPSLEFRHYCLPDEQIFKYGSREYLLELFGLGKKSLSKILGGKM